MTLSGDSLSGQNKGRRAAGTGSSPVLPTKYERTKLWNRLRELDRKHGLQALYMKKCLSYLSYGDLMEQARQKLLGIDLKRKSIRLKLKGYPITPRA